LEDFPGDNVLYTDQPSLSIYLYTSPPRMLHHAIPPTTPWRDLAHGVPDPPWIIPSRIPSDGYYGAGSVRPRLLFRVQRCPYHGVLICNVIACLSHSPASGAMYFASRYALTLPSAKPSCTCLPMRPSAMQHAVGILRSGMWCAWVCGVGAEVGCWVLGVGWEFGPRWE
jgi:hypothetical protein